MTGIGIAWYGVNGCHAYKSDIISTVGFKFDMLRSESDKFSDFYVTVRRGVDKTFQDVARDFELEDGDLVVFISCYAPADSQLPEAVALDEDPIASMKRMLADERVKYGSDYSLIRKYGKTFVTCCSTWQKDIADSAAKCGVCIDKWFVYDLEDIR